MAVSNLYIDKYKEEFNKQVEHFKKDLSSLRTGRAQATLIENIPVESYGVKSPLMQLASISVQDSRSLKIEPWDKNIMKDVEKAISMSNLGLSLINSGDKIIAQVPPMTEENRKDLIKLVSKKVEEAKVSVRKLRDKIKEEIIQAEKDRELTEDDRYKFLADLDNYIGEFSRKLEALAEDKEKDIMVI